VRASAAEGSRLALSPFVSAPVDVHPESSMADFTTIRSSAWADILLRLFSGRVDGTRLAHDKR
jgi:hypothetical protein